MHQIPSLKGVENNTFNVGGLGSSSRQSAKRANPIAADAIGFVVSCRNRLHFRMESARASVVEISNNFSNNFMWVLADWGIFCNFAAGFRNRCRDEEVRVMLRTNVKP